MLLRIRSTLTIFYCALCAVVPAVWFLLSAIPAVAGSGAESSQKSIVRNIDKIEYTFLDSTINSPKEFPAQPVWKPYEIKKESIAPQKDKSLWLRLEVPQVTGQSEVTLYFEKMFIRFDVFSGDKVIYSFGRIAGYPGVPPHLVQLPESDKTGQYLVKVDSNSSRIGPAGVVQVGSWSDFVLRMLKQDGTKVFVICTLGMLAVAGLILFGLYRSVKTYLHLAMFSLCGLLYVTATMQTRVVLGLNPVWVGTIGLFGLYASPIFLIGFFDNIFALSSPRWLKRFSAANLAFVTVAGLSTPFLPLGILTFLPYFYMLAVPTFASLLVYSIVALRKHAYSRTFHTGLSILFLTGIWELANEVRIINSNVRVLPLGVLSFYLALATMQGQFFANLFRTAKRTAEAELMAKEQLKRVLDCTQLLAEARTYRALIQLVVDTISKEINLTGTAYSMDFVFTNIGHSGSDMDDVSIHFTYIVRDPSQRGELYEVMIPKAGSEAESSENKISSLPGVYPADQLSHEYGPASPATTLTIPVHSDDSFGALVIRKFTKGEFELGDRDHLVKFVTSLSASLLVSLKNIDYVHDVKEKVKMDSELVAAQAQQIALLPREHTFENIEIAVYYHSAGRTGGDWYGYHHCKKWNRLFVAVGDVTGHDFAASIITGVAAGAIDLWNECEAERHEDPAAAVEDLASVVNHVLFRSSRGLKYMTMFFTCIDLNTGEYYVVNAGHPHPFRLAVGKEAGSITNAGNLLGNDPATKYKAAKHTLTAGEIVMIYTDGLLENEGPDGSRLNKKRFLKTIPPEGELESRLNACVKHATDIWKAHPPADDVTIVTVMWSPGTKAEDNAA
jgi:serine phosphatase RsbU (regulator of sigma subunit)